MWMKNFLMKDGMMKYNNKFKNSFDRCEKCVYWHSYYFDEWDSDCWCELELDSDIKDCVQFTI